MNLVRFPEIVFLRQQVLDSHVAGLAKGVTQKHRRRMRVLVMREPFRPQRGFLLAAFIIRIEKGNDFETLPDHEGRAIHDPRPATRRGLQIRGPPINRFCTSPRPTAWLSISDTNFDVQRENSSL